MDRQVQHIFEDMAPSGCNPTTFAEQVQALHFRRPALHLHSLLAL